ncbi:MAG: AAA family ATPase [Planctomycetia bacterium]|nr:AAA family ATPase [Planctomycetia bacterium]
MAAPRTQFYHPATQIEAALKGIERCIRRAEGASLVVGSPGTGKSLLLAKVADHVRDDFDVALLSGASICTRRALWQAVLAAIGEPYRGIDEADLRIALVERIRGLAASGSGLAILVDEANTLPTRLIEELRLLTNVPTPLPAVHLVLAGTLRLEEMLAGPRMESLSQRIAVRAYLEPLDHAETMAYLRTQTKAAGLSWDRLFAAGCDDAVFTATDGVPRLINQLCDQALVIVAESSRQVTPADIAAAWREIQRLPAPMGLEPRVPTDDRMPEAARDIGDEQLNSAFGDDAMEMIEFGSGDDAFAAFETPAPAEPAAHCEPAKPHDGDPWNGPDVELVFDQATDPFDSFFREDGHATQRLVVEGPDDFRSCRPVTSREGQAMGRLLVTLSQLDGGPQPAASEPDREQREPEASREAHAEPQTTPAHAAAVVADGAELDDADMVVIEDDLHETDETPRSIFSVRPGDYRSLFTRLRRGDSR